jgi:MFS family permease
MAVRGAAWDRHRLSLPTDPARRAATWSLVMVAASVVTLTIGSAVGTFLQFWVFDLEEQQLLSEAGAWGYGAGFCLLALTVLPPVVGVVLGRRGRRLGERRLGTAGILVNALIVAYLVITGVGTLLAG